MPNLSDDQVQSILTEIRANRSIQAVKLYREFTGTGLAEAKAAVEQMAAGRIPVGGNAPPGLSEDQLRAIRAELGTGNKIQAIKLYREFTGTGLAEAKTAVEQLAAGDAPAPAQAPTPAKTGCGASVILFVVVSVVVYFLIKH